LDVIAVLGIVAVFTALALVARVVEKL